jgi:hypothetical protein
MRNLPVGRSSSLVSQKYCCQVSAMYRILRRMQSFCIETLAQNDVAKGFREKTWRQK